MKGNSINKYTNYEDKFVNHRLVLQTFYFITLFYIMLRILHILFSDLLLKVPSGQIGSASDWYHWKGLEKDINCYRIFIFYFWFWIFEKTSELWAASYTNASNPPTCWDHGLYVHIPRSFPPMRESQQLFLGLRLVSRIFEENQQSIIQTKIEQHIGRFFQQMKVRQPIGRKDSIQTVIPASRRIRCIFVWAQLRTFTSSQIFKIKI